MIAWIGSICLAFCSLPEAIRTLRDKKCHIGWGMLLLWSIGEIFTLIYVIKSTADSALLTNYIFNLILISIMLYYKINPNEKEAITKPSIN